MQTETIPTLQSIGLKPAQLQEWLGLETTQPLGRVCAVDRGACTVVIPTSTSIPSTGHEWGDGLGEVKARPALSDPLAVGDWVVLDADDPSSLRITASLSRTSLLERNAVGGSSASQLIAANIDVVFVVVALTERDKTTRRALNPRRIERYLVAIRQGGAEPVVVINKGDLDNGNASLESLQARLRGVELVRVSALEDDPASKLGMWLTPGGTVAFVGPSGVGKSTLTNRLIGRELLETSHVRAADTKGRHTTTRRLMLRTQAGALLIDTPGMREFGVASAEGIAAEFADIEALGESCRFSDCAHQAEPGCAVRQAVDDGQLSEDELRSYLTLGQEASRQRARHDAQARHEQNQEGRRFARICREVQRIKPGR